MFTARVNLRIRSQLSRARLTSADFDFDQLIFSTSANFDFGQFRLRPISTSANFWNVEIWTTKGGAPKGGAPKGGPQGGGPNIEKVGPRRVGSAKFRTFFPLPPLFILSSLSWRSFVEFWWCFEGLDPEMCTFGVLGLLCEAPAGRSSAGRSSGGEVQRRGGPAEGLGFGVQGKGFWDKNRNRTKRKCRVR